MLSSMIFRPLNCRKIDHFQCLRSGCKHRLFTKWKRNAPNQTESNERSEKKFNERTNEWMETKKANWLCGIWVAIKLSFDRVTFARKFEQTWKNRFGSASPWLSLCWKQKRNIHVDRAKIVEEARSVDDCVDGQCDLILTGWDWCLAMPYLVKS